MNCLFFFFLAKSIASLAQFKQVIENRINGLDYVYKRLNTTYDNWIRALKTYREQCYLLKLFSNRQIMILIILLRTSTVENSIRTRFLKNLFSFKNTNNPNDEEHQLTVLCLKHYLSSLRIQQTNLSYEQISTVYQTHQIESGSKPEVCLEKLTQFLQDLFDNGNELMEKQFLNDDKQQYLVTLEAKQQQQPKDKNLLEHDLEINAFEHDLDMNTLCILLNIFNNRLPSPYQILWCSTATKEDIELFFSRIRTFPYLVFAILDIDKMHHRLRELLLNEQDLLTRLAEPHGIVYYFSRELTISRHGLREFRIPTQYRNQGYTYKQLTTLFQKQHFQLPQIQIIYGEAGIGKFKFC